MLGIVLQYEYYLEYTFLPLSQIYTFFKTTLHNSIYKAARVFVPVI